MHLKWFSSIHPQPYWVVGRAGTLLLWKLSFPKSIAEGHQCQYIAEVGFIYSTFHFCPPG